jgi:hypothetical protein
MSDAGRGGCYYDYLFVEWARHGGYRAWVDWL